MNFYSIPGLRKIQLIVENLIFKLVFGSLCRGKASVCGLPLIFQKKKHSIVLGNNIVLISHPYFSEPGVNHPVILRTISNEATITIGDNVGLSGTTICAQSKVTIGDNVMLGANVSIIDTDFHPIAPDNRRFTREGVKTAPITIDKNVFIGMNTIVMKGVTIGENSVVGAGSIVLKDIPANSIYAGIPAKLVGKL